jgi:Fe-Mn family superoxide dismutase
MWEHAYFMDYGTKKPDYLAAVLGSLNWTTIGQRFDRASK